MAANCIFAILVRSAAFDNKGGLLTFAALRSNVSDANKPTTRPSIGCDNSGPDRTSVQSAANGNSEPKLFIRHIELMSGANYPEHSL